MKKSVGSKYGAKNLNTKKSGMTRREFVGTAAAAAAFTFIPRHVLGQVGQNNSANSKLNIACIGAGGRAYDDIMGVSSENIVALCDVDQKQAAKAFNQFPDARKYSDFRKMLDKEAKNIDAVVVATPDHVHAPSAIMAMKMGKHVYCEKPLTHTVYEARKMTEIARQMKVVTQMGNQGQASEETRLMCEYIWDGAIGPVREVHVWTDRPLRGLDAVYWPQGVGRPKDTPAVPETLDWNLWLGPAPERPYHPSYVPFNWRGWWDFGTGALGDMGCHRIDPVWRALKLKCPESIEAACSLVNSETYPVASIVTYHFGPRGDMPPVKLIWYDGGLRPPRPQELEEGRQWGAEGVLFVGDKGKMLNHLLIPESRRQEYGKPPQILTRSPGHHKEWIEACKGGSDAPGSNFDHAGPLAEAVLLGNIALRPEIKEKLTRATLNWDGPNMKFTNMPEADNYITKFYRLGWTI